MKTTHSGLLGVIAECSESRNALGVAAQHASRLNHEVMCEQTIVVIYNKRGDS